MKEDDLQGLRDAGFDEPELTVAAQVIGYFNYINRIADGLGVDPESDMTLPINEWHAKKGHDYGADPA